MNDFAHIIVFIVPIVLIIAIAIVIITSFDYRLKKQILNSDRADIDPLKLISKTPGSRSEVLKWALVLLFGGIGLVVINYLPYNPYISSLPYGIEAIFIAIGFLVYYFLTKNQTNND